MVLYNNFTPGEVAAAGVVFPVVGAVLVALRTKSQRKKPGGLGAEDWLVFPALAFSFGMGIATIYGISQGAEGYKKSLSKQADTENIMFHIYWNMNWMQPLALGCIKLSFIYFYRRIFNVGYKNTVFNAVSNASLVIMAAWTLAFLLAVLVHCPGHMGPYWGTTVAGKKYCKVTTQLLLAVCWSDMGTDVIVLLMPIPPILKLQMTFRKKVAVIAVFALGAVTLSASILRAVMYQELLGDLKLDYKNMTQTNFVYWMLVETGLALIAVNLPLLYGSFKHDIVESTVRRIRKFIPARASSSTAQVSSKVAPTRKTSSESQRHIIDVKTLDGVSYDTDSDTGTIVTHIETADLRALEEGKIGVESSLDDGQR